MYAYHKQVHAPTAVDHAVYCNFVSTKRKCVVVLCSTRMAVYFVREASLGDGKRTAKMEFFYGASLFGIPMSIGVVPSAVDGRDGLLLAFREAKLVLLTFDIEHHDVRTSWIHNFEDDIRRAVHFEPLLTGVMPIVAVEPQRRMGVLISYGRYLSVVSVSPFAAGDQRIEKSGHVHAEVTPAIHPAERDKGGKCNVRRLFDVDLRVAVASSLRRVIDATFLHGYYEATLCVLYECAPRGADGVARCELVALSISVAFPSATTTGTGTGDWGANTGSFATPIWRLDTLPSDALNVVSVPAPLGGVLIASTNQLVYARQSARTHHVALNSLAFGTPEFPVRGAMPLPVRIALDGARFSFLNAFQCLISLRNGELFVLSLLTDSAQSSSCLPLDVKVESEATPPIESAVSIQFDGRLGVRAFYFERCAASIFASCVCLINADLLLIGSRVANSLLLRFTAKQPIAADRIDAYLAYYASSVKQPNAVSIAQQFSGDSDADDAFLYGTTVKRLRADSLNRLDTALTSEAEPISEHQKLESDRVEAAAEMTIKYEGAPLYSFAFALCDSLLNIAPCRAAALGETASLSDTLASEATRIEWNGEAVTSEESLELAFACGAAKNGAVALLQRGVRPCVASTFPLDACRDVFTVFDDQELTRRHLQAANTKPASGNVTVEHVDGSVPDEPAEAAQSGEEVQTEPELFHRYLLISRPHSTMVLEAANDIAEVETSFCTRDETVTVGQIRVGVRYLTLQVCRRAGIFLVAAGSQLVHSLDCAAFTAADVEADSFLVPTDVDLVVLTAHLLDECCIVLSSRHVAYLVTVTDAAAPQLAVQRLLDTVECLSLYRDSTGLMHTRSTAQCKSEPGATRASEHAPRQVDGNAKQAQLAEEDAFLYSVDELNVQQPMDLSICDTTDASVPNDTYWIVAVRTGGSLEVFSYVHVTTPAQSPLALHFVCHRFASLYPLVAANDLLRPEPDAPTHAQLNDKLDDERCGVLEVLLTDLEALEPRRPFLLVRTADFLHVYEAFSLIGSRLDPISAAAQRRYVRSDSLGLSRLDSVCSARIDLTATESSVPALVQALLVQFRRVEALMFVRGKKESAAEKRKRLAETGESELVQSGDATRTQLKVLRNVSGHSGVFVCGPLPYFVLLSPKGALRTFAMDIDGPVLSFAEFNNVNCPLGFLYFNKRCELRISVLPAHLNYESEWLVRKVPLKATPHFLNYHLDSKTWAVVTSTSVPCTRTWKVNPEGDKECETYERDDRFIFPTVEQFRLELRAPDTFEPVSSAGVEFDECENVTAMKVVNVRSQETVTRFKAVVALGTNYCYGEDVINRGRLFIVDIIEVVPEPGKPLTNKKLKIIHNELQKGPVTAIAGLNGNIVTAIGQKVYIWELKEDHTLDALAFIDTQLYTVSMSTLKNFILIGDIAKGVSVLRYQDEWRVLSFVSRELRQCEVYAVEYFVDQKNLGFLMTDHLQNVIWYSYDPESRESYGGLRLVRKADFNLSALVCTMLRIKSKLNPDFLERKTLVQNEKRHILFGATLDGSMHVFQPIPEKVYRRLNMLHSLLTVHIQHKAGCNPRALRNVVSNTVQLTTPQHNVVDGELAAQFFTMLNRAEQIDLAKRIGTTCEQLYDDIYDLDRLAAHF